MCIIEVSLIVRILLILLQIQQGKFVASQVSADYIGDSFTATATLGNTDIVNESGELCGRGFGGRREVVCL